MADLSVEIKGLRLKNPVMTASGTFGYGPEFADFVPLEGIGGIIVKGTTLKPRQGNDYPRMVETASGMLNCVGLQNKGVDYFCGHIYPEIKDIDTNFIVNVSGSSPEDYAECAARIAELDRIPAIELNISCPNVKDGGMAFGVTCAGAASVVKAVRAKYPKTLIVKLSPNVTDIAEIARAVAVRGLFDTAEACANAAGHLVFKRNLTLYAPRLGIFRHGDHHGLRAACSYTVKPYFIQYGVVCNKTALAGRPVLGCKAHTAILLKLLKHEQVLLRTRPKQENRAAPSVVQAFSEIQQRRNSHAAANQQHLFTLVRRHREAIAQREHAVKHVTGLQAGEAARAVANSRNEQPQLVGVIINEIHRDGAAQESGRRTIDTHLHKLPRKHLGQPFVLRQLD